MAAPRVLGEQASEVLRLSDTSIAPADASSALSIRIPKVAFRALREAYPGVSSLRVVVTKGCSEGLEETERVGLVRRLWGHSSSFTTCFGAAAAGFPWVVCDVCFILAVADGDND